MPEPVDDLTGFMSKLLVSVLGVVEPVLVGDETSPSLTVEGILSNEDPAADFSVVVTASLVARSPFTFDLVMKKGSEALIGLRTGPEPSLPPVAVVPVGLEAIASRDVGVVLYSNLVTIGVPRSSFDESIGLFLICGMLVVRKLPILEFTAVVASDSLSGAAAPVANCSWDEETLGAWLGPELIRCCVTRLLFLEWATLFTPVMDFFCKTFFVGLWRFSTSVEEKYPLSISPGEAGIGAFTLDWR